MHHGSASGTLGRTVPVYLVPSRVLPQFGRLTGDFVRGRYYADKPEGGPDWGLRLGITLPSPK